MSETSFRSDLIAAIPNLRAFAISLTASPDKADDLVQDTLVRALAARESFIEGTNLTAWLFTILRNGFYSDFRKRRREVEDGEGVHAAKLAHGPTQLFSCEMSECMAALAKLPPEQREALLLVTTQELDYGQAAEICGCAVGTIKSRVNRARTMLAELMHRDRYSGETVEVVKARSRDLSSGMKLHHHAHIGEAEARKPGRRIPLPETFQPRAQVKLPGMPGEALARRSRAVPSASGASVGKPAILDATQHRCEA